VVSEYEASCTLEMAVKRRTDCKLTLALLSSHLVEFKPSFTEDAACEEAVLVPPGFVAVAMITLPCTSYRVSSASCTAETEAIGDRVAVNLNSYMLLAGGPGGGRGGAGNCGGRGGGFTGEGGGRGEGGCSGGDAGGGNAGGDGGNAGGKEGDGGGGGAMDHSRSPYVAPLASGGA